MKVCACERAVEREQTKKQHTRTCGTRVGGGGLETTTSLRTTEQANPPKPSRQLEVMNDFILNNLLNTIKSQQTMAECCATAAAAGLTRGNEAFR